MSRDQIELVILAVLCITGISLAPSWWSVFLVLAALVMNVRILLRNAYIKLGRWEFGRMDFK